MEYQTRVGTEVGQWAARLNARVHGVSRSRPVASAQYWLLGMIGSRATEPGLEAAHQRLLLTLSRARRASADVATSRKRLELRIGELEQQAGETEVPGGKATDSSQVDAAGQDQTARDVSRQLADLRRQYADMQAKEQRVHAATRRLFAEVNAFGDSKDGIKAAYTAADVAARAVTCPLMPAASKSSGKTRSAAWRRRWARSAASSRTTGPSC